MNCSIPMLILWLWLLRALSQSPLLSTVTSPRPLGECAALDILTLGNFQKPHTSGLVPHTLVTVAMRKDPSSMFFTTQTPSVQMISAVITCQSLATSTTRYSTTSVLVHYSCRGVACEQQPNNIQTLSYVHLFSFVCEETVNLYTSWDFIPGYSIFVDRITTNSILNPVTSQSGSCSACINDPALSNNPRFRPPSGCIACKPECLSVGLGFCTTSLRDDDQQSCCSYLYQPIGDTSHVCARNCPSPFSSRDHDCRREDFPRVTSIFPNHPSVKLVAGSIPTYTIPIGFQEGAFTCSVVAWTPLIIEWQSDRRTGFESHSTHTENSIFTSAHLQFRNGFTVFDTAKYTCTVREIVSGFSDSVNITLVPSSERYVPAFTPTCVSNSTTAYFQIQVLDTNCTTWMEPLKGEITKNFYDALVGGILSQCEGCVASVSTVMTNPPTCNTLVKRAAIFRGEVTTQQMDRTEAIYCALNQWKQYGPAVVIAGVLKQVDQECHFELTSSNDTSQCSGVTPNIAIPIPTIVGSLAGFGGVLFLLIVVAIFIVLKRRRKIQKKRSFQSHDDYSTICANVLSSLAIAGSDNHSVHREQSSEDMPWYDSEFRDAHPEQDEEDAHTYNSYRSDYYGLTHEDEEEEDEHQEHGNSKETGYTKRQSGMVGDEDGQQKHKGGDRNDHTTMHQSSASDHKFMLQRSGTIDVHTESGPGEVGNKSARTNTKRSASDNKLVHQVDDFRTARKGSGQIGYGNAHLGSGGKATHDVGSEQTDHRTLHLGGGETSMRPRSASESRFMYQGTDVRARKGSCKTVNLGTGESDYRRERLGSDMTNNRTVHSDVGEDYANQLRNWRSTYDNAQNK